MSLDKTIQRWENARGTSHMYKNILDEVAGKNWTPKEVLEFLHNCQDRLIREFLEDLYYIRHRDSNGGG
jgi:hypothetical protein